MTVGHAIILWCDFILGTNRDGSIRHCGETIEINPSSSATEAREVAADEGWGYRRRQDLCPKHKT